MFSDRHSSGHRRGGGAGERGVLRDRHPPHLGRDSSAARARSCCCGGSVGSAGAEQRQDRELLALIVHFWVMDEPSCRSAQGAGGQSRLHLSLEHDIDQGHHRDDQAGEELGDRGREVS